MSQTDNQVKTQSLGPNTCYASHLPTGKMSILADVTCILVIFATFFYFYFIKKFKYWKDKNVKHDNPTIPLGNLGPVIMGECSLGHLVARLYEKFNAPYFGMYSMARPSLVIKDTEIIKNILICDFDKFQNRPFASDVNADPISYNILFGMRGDRWKNMRAKLTPAFTSGKLKLMMPLITECGQDFGKFIKGNLQGVHEMKGVCGRYSTDVISSCAFGLKANSFVSEDAELFSAGKQLLTSRYTGLLRRLVTSLHLTSCLCLNSSLSSLLLDSF